MIQRIQTLYLFLVTVLGILLCFFAPINLLLPEATELTPLATFSTWSLAVITIAIAVVAFVNIFMYKRRILQARINVFNIFLCIGYYALLAWLTYVMYVSLKATAYYINVWAAIPLIQLVLTMMATRRILKDEALVRSMDRIR